MLLTIVRGRPYGMIMEASSAVTIILDCFLNILLVNLLGKQLLLMEGTVVSFPQSLSTRNNIGWNVWGWCVSNKNITYY